MSVTDAPVVDEWRADKNGREFVQGPGQGFAGRIFRHKDETVQEARARAAKWAEEKANAPAGDARARSRKAPRAKGRRPDRPPHVEPEPKQIKAKPSRDQLAAAIEVPLKGIGSFVGYQVLDCSYCAGSMQANAGLAAADLAASDNPYMVALLTWWHGIMMMVMAGGSGIPAYLLPPVVHHAPMPEFLRATASGMMGIPPRAPSPPSAHKHSPGPAETHGPPTADPPAQPPAAGGPPMPPPAPGPRVQPMTPQDAAQVAQERAHLEAEARRLVSIRETAMRQAAAASQPHGPNVPPYAANGLGAIPEAPANIRQAAPGTPAAPAVEGDAGSPLPPEAGEL